MDWYHRIYKDGTKELNWDYDCNSDNMMVAQWNPDGPRHTMFKTFDDAFVFEFILNEDYLFEIIKGDRKQKPYFDFDIKDDISNVCKYNKMIDTFVIKLCDVLGELEENIDILVFTSHRKDKISYHIVIDGIYVESNEHNRTFCDKLMTDELREAWDKDLYKSLQQFRIYGCSKCGRNNKKLFSPKLSTLLIPKKFDELERHYYIYHKSLITKMNDCELYPIEIKEKKKHLELKVVSLNFISNRAIKLFQRDYKYEFFQVGCVRESNERTIIELKTHEPYGCHVCKRTHDNENPFIYITPHKEVFFNCRRTKKSHRIGNTSKI